MRKKKLILILSAIVFLGAIAVFSFSSGKIYWQKYLHLRELNLRKAAWQKLEAKIKNRVLVFGQASGIVIKDLKYGWELAINETQVFPSASLVKLPIMAVLLCGCEEKKIDLNQQLELFNNVKVSGTGKLKEYVSGTKFSVGELIEIMVAQSDNTGANMLINYSGFEYLNSCFKRMGLNNTNIVRGMMDFKKRKAGFENYTNARDTAYLLEKIYTNEFVSRACSRRCLDILKKQEIRDRIPKMLPEGILVAHKTGLERGVCHDAGIIFTSNGDLLICVLTKHNYKTARPAKRFIAQIALDVYNYGSFESAGSSL